MNRNTHKFHDFAKSFRESELEFSWDSFKVKDVCVALDRIEAFALKVGLALDTDFMDSFLIRRMFNVETNNEQRVNKATLKDVDIATLVQEDESLPGLLGTSTTVAGFVVGAVLPSGHRIRKLWSYAEAGEMRLLAIVEDVASLTERPFVTCWINRDGFINRRSPSRYLDEAERRFEVRKTAIEKRRAIPQRPTYRVRTVVKKRNVMDTGLIVADITLKEAIAVMSNMMVAYRGMSEDCRRAVVVGFNG